MALTPGSRLGVYEITAQIGEGGMGQVYRARDTKLDRDVAIKILPEAFAHDADRLARFTREAKTLASLNHPHIAAIYGLEESAGESALVMELVEGEDLSQRIARGAIPLDEALPIAKQIADALEAAHEQGIIHRDLKPANIKVRADGTVKVLDFGLAKAMDPAGASGADAMNAPTLSVHATMQGVILGTAAYMAPEQARGRAVDRRADIWAFGVVLYEMLSGRRAFEGDDISITLAAVLKDSVQWDVLPAELPAGLRRLLRRCLEKDPKQRLRDIGDARIELTHLMTGESDASNTIAAMPSVPAPVIAQLKRRERTMWIAAAVVLVLTGVIVWWLKPAPASTNVVTRFTFTLPEGQDFSRTGRRFVAIAPDGSKVAYIANKQIYVRVLSQLTAQSLAGTNEDPLELVFSPDSQWIAYFAAPAGGAEFTLKKIAVSGGTPVTLCTTSAPFGSSWHNGTIVFGQNSASVRGIQAVADTGGTPRTLVTADNKEAVAGPQMLDDGRHVIFTTRKSTGTNDIDEADIVVQGVDGGARKTLVHGGTDGRVLPDGHLLYATGGNLFAVAFDARTLVLGGDPVLVLEGVQVGGIGAGEYALSDTGTLVYEPGKAAATAAKPRTMVWIDRQGHEQPIAVQPKEYRAPRLSPDGSHFVVSARSDNNGQDLWVWDREHEILRPLTAGLGQNVNDGAWRPAWMPDGRRVVFGYNGIWRVGVDGTGTPENLLAVKWWVEPYGVSPDGRFLVYVEDQRGTTGTAGTHGIAVLPLDGHGQPHPLIQSKQTNPLNAEISPDGRWIAYQSNESGNNEIYVRPFPAVDSGRWQVSNGGGTRPVWSRDGHELFYQPTLKPGKMVVVAVRTAGATFTYGKPQPLFDVEAYYQAWYRTWDVSADGKKFLMIKNAQAAAPTERRSLTIVTHWLDELKTRVK